MTQEECDRLREAAELALKTLEAFQAHGDVDCVCAGYNEEEYCLGPAVDALKAALPLAQCPHGNTIGECNACDVAGDFAFDAARERR